MDTPKLVCICTICQHGARAPLWYSSSRDEYSYDAFDDKDVWRESVLGYRTLESALVAAQHALEHVIAS